jgi:hypothetical protein
LRYSLEAKTEFPSLSSLRRSTVRGMATGGNVAEATLRIFFGIFRKIEVLHVEESACQQDASRRTAVDEWWIWAVLWWMTKTRRIPREITLRLSLIGSVELEATSSPPEPLIERR